MKIYLNVFDITRWIKCFLHHILLVGRVASLMFIFAYSCIGLKLPLLTTLGSEMWTDWKFEKDCTKQDLVFPGVAHPSTNQVRPCLASEIGRFQGNPNRNPNPIAETTKRPFKDATTSSDLIFTQRSFETNMRTVTRIFFKKDVQVMLWSLDEEKFDFYAKILCL